MEVVHICHAIEMRVWKIFRETRNYGGRLTVQKFSEAHTPVCCTTLKLWITFLILKIKLYFFFQLNQCNTLFLCITDHFLKIPSQPSSRSNSAEQVFPLPASCFPNLVVYFISVLWILSKPFTSLTPGAESGTSTLCENSSALVRVRQWIPPHGSCAVLLLMHFRVGIECLVAHSMDNSVLCSSMISKLLSPVLLPIQVFLRLRAPHQAVGQGLASQGSLQTPAKSRTASGIGAAPAPGTGHTGGDGHRIGMETGWGQARTSGQQDRVRISRNEASQRHHSSGWSSS